MQRFRWIALQGSSRGFLPPLLLFVFLITTSGIPAFAADVTAACSSPVARVVSIQGSIELLRARQNDWSKVTRLDTPLCEGDRLRTGALSRAALFIQPETLVRVDQNTSISVSQTAEETLVEFTQEDIVAASTTAHTCGAGYFITRFPRKFRVNTPHLNAAVEGTEFLVAMRCESTELSVFEGKVLAAGAGANIFPAQSISSGQILTIGGSEPPAVKLLVKPTDAVQWVLYYPPLSDAKAEANLPSTEQCRSLPKPLDQTCLTQRAEVLLRLGRVDEAQREVDAAAALDSGRGDANALRAIISIARNDKAGAIEAATAGTTASPNSFRAWLALSYAQQASFKLDKSLVSARKAQALEPSSSVTNARVAELLMSLGRIKEAEVAARAAVDANPSESRAHTVLGFVHLAQIRTKEARADFEAAIERDSSDPLPRLGLGLAIIRTGKLVEGREQLEIAVALDPTNSLLRSYVGKAYYEENSKERDKLASTQFGLAKQLDPNDPTPWFYDAILEQTHNNAVEAVEKLEKSISLNDNRAVYRSKLLLDDDRAARTTSLADAYRELAFDQRALSEATRSLGQDPTSASAHRFLADSYASLPRHDIARQSELLQSQLRQPASLLPLQPELTTMDPEARGILRTSGPATAGVYEFTPLFVSDGLSLQARVAAGSHDTTANQFALSGLRGPFAFSLSHAYYDTDGFRPNNDFTKSIDNGFFQYDFGTTFSMQLEARQFSTDHGDPVLRFDPNLFFQDRGQINGSYARIGGHYALGAQSDLLVSLMTIDADNPATFPGGTITQNFHTRTGELQHSYRGSNLSMISGVGLYSQRKDVSTSFGFQASDTIEAQNAYLYTTVSGLLPDVQLQLGVSYDHLDPEVGIRDSAQEELNPKVGVIWDITRAATFRAASFYVVKRGFFTSQSLEPTQVAGFNQFFDDFDGTQSWRYGAAIDLKLTPLLFAGIEASARDLDIPQGGGFFTWREQLGRAYVHWAPTKVVAVSAGYEHEHLRRDPQLTGFELFLQATTESIPVSATISMPYGLRAQVTETFVSQRGQFFSSSLAPDPVPGSTELWITDLALTYRLPGRRGMISLEARNLFNQNFQFQETDVVYPRFARDRVFFVRGVFAF